MISAGKGKFGLVYLAQHKGSGKYVAIKYITKQAIFDSQRIDKFQQEFNVLQTIRHPFIMECYGGIDVSEYFDSVLNVLTSVSSHCNTYGSTDSIVYWNNMRVCTRRRIISSFEEGRAYF